MKFGVIGDDITGCVDIGLMFVNANLVSNVFTKEQHLYKRNNVDVVICDTDSRFVDAKEAYRRVFHKTLELKELGAQRYYKKTCSVFRGNIGAELDAMLDALEEDFALIVVGFPDTGRTTIHSIHYVDGVRLENSQFQNDPMNPMTLSDVRDIIKQQSKRKVAAIWWEDLDKGVEHVKERIEELRKEASYVCIDVRDQHDLAIIASAGENIKVYGGASALAFELGNLFTKGKEDKELHNIENQKKGILACCGSVTKQSKQQIEYVAYHQKCHIVALNPIEMINGNLKREKIIEECSNLINKGIDVLFHTEGTGDTDFIRKTQKFASENGLGKEQLGKNISYQIADIMHDVHKLTGQRRMIFAGGDTSYHCCKKFGIKDLLIYKEVESGIPLCIGYGKQEFFLILKSGSFGSDEFFGKAITILKKQ